MRNKLYRYGFYAAAFFLCVTTFEVLIGNLLFPVWSAFPMAAIAFILWLIGLFAVDEIEPLVKDGNGKA